MHMKFSGKRMIAIVLFTAIAMAVSLAETACEGSPDKSMWSGNGVTLEVEGPFQPGKGRATLTYTGTRACKVTGKYYGQDGAKQTFSPLMSNDIGSFCQNNLINGKLEIWKEKNSGGLSYEVYKTDGKPLEGGTLSREKTD